MIHVYNTMLKVNLMTFIIKQGALENMLLLWARKLMLKKIIMIKLCRIILRV